MSNESVESEYLLAIANIPRGHIIVGYVSHLKVLDNEGELYFAQRTGGLNDMEKFGLSVSMADSMSDDLLGKRREVE